MHEEHPVSDTKKDTTKKNCSRCALALTRVALGWLFFYAGITKVLNPEWSAAGYLNSAKTFSGFYAWLASPELLPITNFLNEWGLTLIGVALIFGVFGRLASVLGSAMMLMYWFPVLDFPKVDHGYLVDDHIIYALVLAYFAAIRVGRTYGLDAKLADHRFFTSRPKLRDILL